MGAVLIVAGILYDPRTYLVVFFVITACCLWEFYRLFQSQNSRPLSGWGIVFGMTMMVIGFGVMRDWWLPEVFWLLAPLGFLIFILKLYDVKDEQPVAGIATTWLGIIYIAVPFTLLHWIAYAPGYYEYQLVLGVLLLHWAHDVGAYFAGVQFGRTKLFERWSPKKSWEGSAGGTILTLACAAAGAQWAYTISMYQWIGVALIIIVTGTYGDLVESQLKRTLSIKDSGSSIPGHGGFLDRFDGMLISIPLIAAYLQLIFNYV